MGLDNFLMVRDVAEKTLKCNVSYNKSTNCCALMYFRDLFFRALKCNLKVFQSAGSP